MYGVQLRAVPPRQYAVRVSSGGSGGERARHRRPQHLYPH
ncbi:hypothetical protein MMMB2_3713 [Mycobacterium marinum MB2]|nr:hypothetical protein MMSP_0821 [Mycobacterium sp. 012931]EPQ79050.1 hypothetical protein MMMB2_3713 [Mycobacterium marinum MB2]